MAAAAGEQDSDGRCRDMEVQRPEPGDRSLQVVQKPENTRVKLVLYHWSQSFCSQKVRLVIAEKGLKCEEYDVNLPLSEHNEPWFMRLNPAGEVPVLIHGDNIICESTLIIDYLENTFEDVIPLLHQIIVILN